MSDSKLVDLDVFKTIINERALRRNLSITFTKMKYALNEFLDINTPSLAKRALFIGVGQGHNAILAMLEGRIENIDGVDPYVGSDGNDDYDYYELKKLISLYKLDDNFFIHKESIEEFLLKNKNKYDLIVIEDVLHHIFVTCELLSKSILYESSKKLFWDLWEASSKGCILAIAESPRNGLRPFLVKNRLLRESVDYSTKQPSIEWCKVANKKWSFISYKNYIPYSLRKCKLLLKYRFISPLFATKYFLYFRAK